MHSNSTGHGQCAGSQAAHLKTAHNIDHMAEKSSCPIRALRTASVSAKTISEYSNVHSCRDSPVKRAEMRGKRSNISVRQRAQVDLVEV